MSVSDSGLLSLYVPANTQDDLAYWIRQRRKALHLSRRALSEQTGVPESTIKRFELTGEVSLRQFLELWFAVDRLDRIEGLLSNEAFKRPPRTIKEVIAS